MVGYEKLFLWAEHLARIGPGYAQKNAYDSESLFCLRVLIICNIATGEIGSENRPPPGCCKNLIFALSQKTHENPIDFNSSYFHQNSTRELSFYFCRTSAAKRVRNHQGVARLRPF